MPPPYGPHEVDDDFFAARVLQDLTRAMEADVPRILARFAALRSWLLRDHHVDPILVRHAAETASAYLAAVGDWTERQPLTRLTAGDPELDAIRDAARSAEAMGHLNGASALLRAGYLSARRRGDIAGAATLAEQVATLLRRYAMDGAELWARRANRLRRFDEL